MERNGLSVRQHEREGIAVPVEFTVAAQHASQVKFSSSSTAAGAQTVRGQAIDVSSGGIGIHCAQLLPRMCEGVLRVFVPAGDSGEESGGLELAFEHPAKVRRVSLLNREPRYSIGLAFLGGGAGLEKAIGALLRRLDETPRSPQPAGAAGGDRGQS